LFIGTQKANERFEEEKPNNLQLEVKHVTAKLKDQPNCLVPLLLGGRSPGDAFPKHWEVGVDRAAVELRGGFPHPNFYRGIIEIIERVFGPELASHERYQKAKKLFVATYETVLQLVFSCSTKCVACPSTICVFYRPLGLLSPRQRKRWSTNTKGTWLHTPKTNLADA
jgi:hypothetical protein